jgi:hypothetical protein
VVAADLVAETTWLTRRDNLASRPVDFPRNYNQIFNGILNSKDVDGVRLRHSTIASNGTFLTG